MMSRTKALGLHGHNPQACMRKPWHFIRTTPILAGLSLAIILAGLSLALVTFALVQELDGCGYLLCQKTLCT